MHGQDSKEEPITIDFILTKIGAAIFSFFFMAALCGGCFYPFYLMEQGDRKRAEERLAKQIATETNWLEANDYKAVVLTIYPEHGHRGRFIGYVGIVEGLKTRERKSLYNGKHLPVPGEKWKLTVNHQGQLQYEEPIRD